MPEVIRSFHIVGSRLFGGAEHFYLRLLRLLREAGHPVTAINRPGTPVAGALAAEAFEQCHVPMANGWDLWSCWRLRRIVAHAGPCIVQTYMGRAARLTRLSPKTSAIHIARLGGYYKIDGYYRHAHAWIGNTQGLCDYLVKSGLPAQRVFHIGNCVPEPAPTCAADQAVLREQYRLPLDTWVLFTLGRLVDYKGFDDLLRAVARLPREIAGQPWVLMIAGDGPESGPLQALARDLGLEDRTRWLGWQDQPDPFFAVADAFICPSRHETLGNVILEAWSHGVPVISTETRGATELVEPGVTGLLCALQDPKALAHQILALLSVPEPQRKALGEAGQAFLREQFSPAAIRDAYLGLYRQLMAERGDG